MAKSTPKVLPNRGAKRVGYKDRRHSRVEPGLYVAVQVQGIHIPFRRFIILPPIKQTTQVALQLASHYRTSLHNNRQSYCLFRDYLLQPVFPLHIPLKRNLSIPLPYTSKSNYNENCTITSYRLDCFICICSSSAIPSSKLPIHCKAIR